MMFLMGIFVIFLIRFVLANASVSSLGIVLEDGKKEARAFWGEPSSSSDCGRMQPNSMCGFYSKMNLKAKVCNYARSKSYTFEHSLL